MRRLPGIENCPAPEPHGILLRHSHHRPPVLELAAIEPAADIVHRLQPRQVGLAPDPAGPYPGDVVVGEDDRHAQAPGLEGVLEVRPGPDPGSGDGMGVGADVLHKPLLGQDLGSQHRLGISVVIPEADADHGDEKAMGQGRKDGHPVGPLEPLGLLHPGAARLDLLDRDADFDDRGAHS